MGYKNEAEIRQALGIESWRHLSKDKMIRFVAMMPDMDTEVALKIIEQFPVFKDFAKGAVDVMEKAYESTLSANEQSQKQFYQALQETRESIQNELGKDGLDWEQKRFLIEQIQETLRLASLKDSENKQFLDRQLTKKLVGVGAVLVLCVAFVGGKIGLERKGSPEDSVED
ncbi:hypothetical protein [Streptomyces collinus]|uniref:hypothetical protein n=1 Tax=Streptomyces collinus TaxID=42684 RepID=UPI0033D597FE